MARKTLLTEGELRRFMKLAELRPVGEERMSEMYGMPGARDEEDEDELHATEDELGDMDAEADREGDEVADLEGELGAAEDELGATDELGDEPPLDPEAQAVLARGIQAMADAMGMGDLVTVDVEPEPAEVEDVVDVTDVELDEPVEPAGEEGGELDFEMGPEDEEEDPEAAMVAEVARRVAARLQKESRQAKVVDQLAERIMKRLTK